MTFRLTELSSPQEMCHLMVEAFWSYFSGNQKGSRAYRTQHRAAPGEKSGAQVAVVGSASQSEAFSHLSNGSHLTHLPH